MPAFVVAAAASAINRTKPCFRTCSGQKLNLNQSWLFLIRKKRGSNLPLSPGSLIKESGDKSSLLRAVIP